MSKKELAKNIFLGRNNEIRLNCAQAVIASFKDEIENYENTIDLFKFYSIGRVPRGYCGAYYAVYYILQKVYPDKKIDFEKYFIGQLGFTTCKELKMNKISCIKCIEKSAEFLESKLTWE
ncbi:C-GCAxxG-C-C family (seleno)protein [bacterium]